MNCTGGATTEIGIVSGAGIGHASQTAGATGMRQNEGRATCSATGQTIAEPDRVTPKAFKLPEVTNRDSMGHNIGIPPSERTAAFACNQSSILP